MELISRAKTDSDVQAPADWLPRTIASFASFVTKGATPTTYGFEWQRDGVVFLRSECVSDAGLDLRQAMFVSPAAYRALSRGEVRGGDVLMTITGNVGRVVMLDSTFAPALINQHVARIRVSDRSVSATYVYYWLSQSAVRAYFSAITTGQAYPQISLRQVRDAPVLLPKYSEQCEIATVLEDVDALLVATSQVTAKKRDLKQAAMQRLLTGEERLPGFDGGWSETQIGDVADVDPDQLSALTPPSYSFQYISLEDVDGGSLLSSTEHSFRTAPSRARRRVRPGDVLMATVRPSLQGHLLFERYDRNWVCSTGFAVIRARPDLAWPAFLFHSLFGLRVGRQVENIVTGSNYPAISSRDVRALSMLLPSLDEQRAIAAVLADMDAELAALERRLAKTRALKQAMMQELLTGRTRLATPTPERPS